MTELELYSSYDAIIYMENSSNVVEDTDNVTKLCKSILIL